MNAEMASDEYLPTVRLEDNPQVRLYNIEDVLNPKRYKIITVDDNKYVNNSVKNIIEAILNENYRGKDYDVLTGCDGIDILNFIREDQVNGNLIKCIITDENMEFLSGSQAIQIVRNFEKSNIIKPVNLITSTCHEDEVIKNSILESGAQMVLSKPLNKTELFNAFKELNII
jgi:CheY-like chemotaxis protein